jgi:hypothetical protein
MENNIEILALLSLLGVGAITGAAMMLFEVTTRGPGRPRRK